MTTFSSVQDFEDHAAKVLSLGVKNYYFGGSGSQKTIKYNREAFDKWRICPKYLRNVSKRDISTTVLGERVSMPLGISPTARQKWVHLDGECASAKEVAEAAPKAIKWQQITMHNDRDCNVHMIRRAEQAGSKAIVVTIDNAIMPKGKSSSLEVNSDATFRLYEDYFLTKYSKEEMGDAFSKVKAIIDDSLTWEDISWVKSITKLPIVVKGILRAEDAVMAVKHGASAILVSNHGGRQLDSVPATLDVLPEIVKAVGNKVEVYLDGGVRRGVDVFKALALGAKMVFVGRPIIWRLVGGGVEGACRILQILKDEIDETFGLLGCLNIQEATEDFVRHESVYSHA